MSRQPGTFNNITELIGRTPLIKLRPVTADSADVFVKLEYYNPGGSIKDRIALQMIKEAEQAGAIKPGDTLIEATSGNTGIGIALVAAAKGYRAVIVMPANMSKERQILLRAYGAELVLTDADLGMNGALARMEELIAERGYYPLRQFENPANPRAHELYTGPEIMIQMQGMIDGFVAGIGTGGTITGVGRALRGAMGQVPEQAAAGPDGGAVRDVGRGADAGTGKLVIVGVEPLDSPVLSGGKAGVHQLQGIGAGFVPPVLDMSIYDELMLVTTEQAFQTAQRLAQTEGILVGISSGATIYAALQLAERLGAGKRVVTIAASGGERYLSTPLYG